MSNINTDAISTYYRELLLAIEDAETICNLVEVVGRDLDENNVAYNHIYGLLCEKANDKIAALIGASRRYKNEIGLDTNEEQRTTTTN